MTKLKIKYISEFGMYQILGVDRTDLLFYDKEAAIAYKYNLQQQINYKFYY